MAHVAAEGVEAVKPVCRRRRWWKVAAVVLLLVVATGVYSSYRMSQRAELHRRLIAKGVVLSNALDKADAWWVSLLEKLPDGMQVWIFLRLPPVSANINAPVLADADAELLSRVTTLESIHLMNLQMTEAGFAHLTTLPNLRFLTCSAPLPWDYWPHLSRCNRLEYLTLPFEFLTEDALASISKLDNLRTLSLWGSTVSTSGFERLSRLKKLESLSLTQRTGLDDRVIITINNLHGLRRLAILGGGVTDAKLALLEGFDRLELLNLSRTAITDGTMPHLLKFVKLKNLSLVHTAVTDEAVKTLKQMKHLEVVNLENTKVTPEGKKELLEALPHLQISIDQ